MGIILHFLYHGLFDKDIKMIDFWRWPKPPTNEIIKKNLNSYALEILKIFLFVFL